MSHKNISILLVEDNPGDVRLTREALAESGLSSTLHVANDGVQAMQFLGRALLEQGSSLPDLILLDLNLPGMSGNQVLERLKHEPRLSVIPVVVLSTSDSESDVRACYAAHANCYIIKPASYAPFLEAVESIERFWLETARLPQA